MHDDTLRASSGRGTSSIRLVHLKGSGPRSVCRRYERRPPTPDRDTGATADHPRCPKSTVYSAANCVSSVSRLVSDNLVFLSFSFRRPNTTCLRAGAIIHLVGQQNALKMNKSRPALISHIHSDKPDVRFGFLALSRCCCAACS